MSALEAMVGSVAIERRLQSGALAADAVPPALRDLQRELIALSPLALAVDQPYELAPLFAHYRAAFETN
jgi:hypothetical protein